MARLDTLIVSRQRERDLEQRPALGLGVGEVVEQTVGIGVLEVVGGELALVLKIHVTVTDAGAVPVQVEHVVGALNVHRQSLEPIGDLARDDLEIEAADLLEIGELADLHAVAPDFPADARGTQGWALPVVLDKADVVQLEVDGERRQAFEIDLLDVVRRRFEDDLELIIALQPIGVNAARSSLIRRRMTGASVTDQTRPVQHRQGRTT